MAGVYLWDMVLATVNYGSPEGVHIVGAYALAGRIVVAINEPSVYDVVVGYFVIRVGLSPFGVGPLNPSTERQEHL